LTEATDPERFTLKMPAGQLTYGLWISTITLALALRWPRSRLPDNYRINLSGRSALLRRPIV
jgi:hypothetical protein